MPFFFRTGTILELLSARIPLILVDSDHYWMESPLPWLLNQTGYDVIVENNSIPPAWSVCAGFLYLNCTDPTLQLWRKVDQHTKFFRSFTETKHINEQTVISRTLFEMQKRGEAIRRQKRRIRTGVLRYWSIADEMFPAPKHLKWGLFPLETVVNGKN